MTLLQAILLGIIQGITEFLPISSSAHLVLTPYLLGWQLDQDFIFSFNVLVQVGTLAAVIAYFRDDLWIIAKEMVTGIIKGKPFAEIPARTGYFVLLATIPAGIVGLLAKDVIAAAFNSPRATSLFLIGTAALLIISEKFGKRDRDLEDMGTIDAIWIGLFQALSVFPGISRSGSTITGGMTRHFDRKTAGQFAFLMSIPIMLAAGSLEAFDLLSMEGLARFLPVLLAGFAAAAVSGFLAIRWLLRYISQHSLLPFAVYCVLLGAGTFSLTLTSPRGPSANFQPIDTEAIAIVAFDPDLKWMLPIMVDCQQKEGDFQAVYQEKSWKSNIYSTVDVYMSLGEQEGMGRFAYLLGEDEVIPVVHPGLSISNMPDQLIRDIFSGSISTWDEVFNSCRDCFDQGFQGDSQAIQVYGYSNQSMIARVFSASYLKAGPAGVNIRLAPGAEAMREMVSMDQNALGYLPRSWVNDSINAVLRGNNPEKSAFLPIIATSQVEPQNSMKAWLACVQEALDNR